MGYEAVSYRCALRTMKYVKTPDNGPATIAKIDATANSTVARNTSMAVTQTDAKSPSSDAENNFNSPKLLR